MQNFFETPKKKIIVISAASIILLTLIIVMVGIFAVSKPSNNDIDSGDKDSVGAFADIGDETEKKAQTTQKPSGTVTEPFLFTSNEDGTCTLTAIGTFNDSDLEIPEESPAGDTVTAIGDKAFENCVFLETVTIPETIKKIGNSVFKGCSSLKSISVSSSNTKYCSVGGVLFSKDKTVLICYPSMKVGQSYLLSTNVSSISPYAFNNVTYLEKILYQSSSSKFQAIEVGAGNGSFESAAVTYNYVPAK